MSTIGLKTMRKLQTWLCHVHPNWSPKIRNTHCSTWLCSRRCVSTCLIGLCAGINLNWVVLQVVEEFKLHAREKKFVVRDFTYNEEELAAGKSEITKLVTDKKKQFVSSAASRSSSSVNCIVLHVNVVVFQGPLVRWLKVNFSETFCAWIHVKALRVFVESVLR